MRYPQYTLTPAHIHIHVRARLQKYLRLADHGRRCTADTLWTVLCYAASRIISLAAACAALRDAPSDTAAHDALLATLPNYAELQRRLNRALQGDLPHALRRRRQPMAIDLHAEPAAAAVVCGDSVAVAERVGMAALAGVGLSPAWRSAD